MNYLLVMIAFGTISARAELGESHARCELALIQALPTRLEFAPDVDLKAIGDPLAFGRAWPRLLEFAVPSPGARWPLTFQTVYVRNKQLGGLVHVEFYRPTPDVTRVVSLKKMTEFGENAFYGTCAYFYGLEPIDFEFAPDAAPLKVGDQEYRRIKLTSSIRAKLWVKHELKLDAVKAILSKSKHARPVQGPGVSAARVFYQRVPMQLFFYKLHDVMYLRTIYRAN